MTFTASYGPWGRCRTGEVTVEVKSLRRCPACRGRLSPLSLCTSCGVVRVRRDVREVEAELACLVCNAPHPTQFVCGSCNARFPFPEIALSEPPTAVCPSCGKPVSVDADRCAACGTTFTDEWRPQAPAASQPRRPRRAVIDYEDADLEELQWIPGVGRAAAETLARHGYSTTWKVKQASEEQLTALPGIGPKLAHRITDALWFISMQPPTKEGEGTLAEEYACPLCACPTSPLAPSCLDCGLLFEPEGVDARVRDEVARDPYPVLAAYYTDRISRRPTDPDLWYAKALALRRMGRLEEAIDVLDFALAIKPDKRRVQLVRAEVLARLHRMDDAAEAIRSVVRGLLPEPPEEVEAPVPPPPSDEMPPPPDEALLEELASLEDVVGASSDPSDGPTDAPEASPEEADESPAEDPETSNPGESPPAFGWPSAARTPLDKSQINRAKKAELVRLAREYGLNSVGTKAVLRKRLLQYQALRTRLVHYLHKQQAAKPEPETVTLERPKEASEAEVVLAPDVSEVAEELPEVVPTEEPVPPPEAEAVPVEAPAVEMKCPVCGKPAPMDMTICLECGADLTDDIEAAARRKPEVDEIPELRGLEELEQLAIQEASTPEAAPRVTEVPRPPEARARPPVREWETVQPARGASALRLLEIVAETAALLLILFAPFVAVAGTGPASTDAYLRTFAFTFVGAAALFAAVAIPLLLGWQREEHAALLENLDGSLDPLEHPGPEFAALRRYALVPLLFVAALLAATGWAVSASAFLSGMQVPLGRAVYTFASYGLPIAGALVALLLVRLYRFPFLRAHPGGAA